MTTLHRRPATGGRSRRPALPRTPALDGLRGLAICAVVAYHFPVPSSVLGVPCFAGGFFGVGVFFVLSGFLITTVLLADHERHGGIRLAAFYRRRCWRLVPALVAFLAVVLLVGARFGREGWFASTPFGPPHAPGPPTPVGSLLWPAAAALGYVYNLFLAFQGAVDVAMPQPFGHLWTLSVEGQFYLGWAVLTALALRRGRAALAGVTCALLAVSVALPFLLWGSREGIQNWIYFGTVPRLAQLCAGALLAQVWAAGGLRRVPAPVLRWAGAVGAAVLAYLLLEVGQAPAKFVGGPQLAAACGVLVVAALVDPRTQSLGSALLASRPLAWLGRRSYGIYLWHWPLALWTNELPRHLGLPLGLLGSLVAAELSWRLVEGPAQRLGRRLEPRARSASAVPAPAS
ncbi:MAG TPA: acyltransferase [Motilibacteraceae bacterium]|nr:acyltransferase [Motilibacteraceae bacterium]